MIHDGNFSLNSRRRGRDTPKLVTRRQIRSQANRATRRAVESLYKVERDIFKQKAYPAKAEAASTLKGSVSQTAVVPAGACAVRGAWCVLCVRAHIKISQQKLNIQYPASSSSS